MLRNRPVKISVIMPSYSQADYVEEALLSALDQDYPHKEVLFLDGGSTDGTMEIVNRHRDRLAVCVSERDDGQSDAMRKGFERASGDVLTWLNTDDILLPGALAEVARVFEGNPGCEWAFGNIVWIDADGAVIRCGRGEDWWPILPRVGTLTAAGPSAFFAKSLYDRVGGINLDLHYKMDTELWWRFAMAGARYHRLRRYTWAYRLHETAKTAAPLFAGASDPTAAKTHAARAAEQRQIEAMTKGFTTHLPSPVTLPLRVAARIATPGYLRGFWESRHFRGRPIEQLMEALCPPAH